MGKYVEDEMKETTERRVMEAVEKFFSGEEFDVKYKEVAPDWHKMAFIEKNGRWIGEIFYDSDPQHVYTYTMGDDPEDMELFEKAVEDIKRHRPKDY